MLESELRARVSGEGHRLEIGEVGAEGVEATEEAVGARGRAVLAGDAYEDDSDAGEVAAVDKVARRAAAGEDTLTLDSGGGGGRIVMKYC